jgi:hypothetical protein
MATTAFPHADQGTFPLGFMRLSEAWSRLHESNEVAVSDPRPEVDGVDLESQSTALCGARGAAIAIFLESYAVLAIYIIWQYFRLFR